MAHDGRVRWMRYYVEEYRDPVTGEVGSTRLAEDACEYFDGYGPAPDYEIPERYFEWAFLVAEEAEGKGSIRAGVGGLVNAVPADYL